MKSLNFISLFSGSGGFGEGFIRQRFKPVAHVEVDKAACYTLRTRAAYHYLLKQSKEDIYYSYLKGEITRNQLYSFIPQEKLNSVINAEIGPDNKKIFNSIDKLLNRNKVDLIIGGPPCQAYSKAGIAPLKNKTEDKRATLYIQYGKFLEKYKPNMFVFENVPGMKTIHNGKYFINLKTYFRRIGYQLEERTLNALDYGVIQNRKRMLIVGWKKDFSLNYPDITPIKEKFYRDEIFYDLPSIQPGENKKIQYYINPDNQYLKKYEIRNGIPFVSQHITRYHNEKDLKIYELAIRKLSKGERLKNNNIPDNIRTQKNITDFLDRFKVVDKIPHTMIAHIAKDGHHYIHPDITQLRSISVREAARIQSFPDDYYFEGVRVNQYRTAAFNQIGNAVPPLLAEKIAQKIEEILYAE